MNQKDWVEYFEAVNGRKPSMQEFQEAREKGEFVVIHLLQHLSLRSRKCNQPAQPVTANH